MTRTEDLNPRGTAATLVRGPVLAVCGWSGSGKTTVLREVIPVLIEHGLSVAVVKHDAHGIQVDPRGKDSDRLFAAGADVMLHGPDQSLLRTHGTQVVATPDGTRGGDLAAALTTLLREYDVVLVEGHKDTPLPKVWVVKDGETGPPDGVRDVLDVLPRDGQRGEALLRILGDWLPKAWRSSTVNVGVVVGGRSERMGWPKQLLEYEGKSFLERVLAALAPFGERVVLLGDGPVPEACGGYPRLPDPPGLGGPLAGILAAMRWDPGATWVVAGCDQPLIEPDAIAWLLDQRAPGKWAVLPRVGEGGVEPLLAIYDARARRILESLAAGGCLAPSALASHPRTLSPSPPAELAEAWRDFNTREELDRLGEQERRDAGRSGG